MVTTVELPGSINTGTGSGNAVVTFKGEYYERNLASVR